MEEDCGFEVFDVSEAASSSLNGHFFLLFKPSATPLVTVCKQEVRILSKRSWIILQTR